MTTIHDIKSVWSKISLGLLYLFLLLRRFFWGKWEALAFGLYRFVLYLIEGVCLRGYPFLFDFPKISFMGFLSSFRLAFGALFWGLKLSLWHWVLTMKSYGRLNPIAIDQVHIFQVQVDKNDTSFPIFILPPNDYQEFLWYVELACLLQEKMLMVQMSWSLREEEYKQ